MNSLSRRLQVGLALTVLLFMTSIWLVGSRGSRSLTEQVVDSRLEHDGNKLLSLLVLDGEGARMRWRRVDQLYNQPFSGHYYAISLDDGTRLTSPSLWDETLSFPSLAPGEVRRLRSVGPEEQKLLVRVAGFRREGRNVTLAVAEDVTEIENQRLRFQKTFALLALAGLGVLLLVQSLVVRHAMRRLEPVCRDIRLLEEGRAERITEEVPTEIQPLVREFNRLLALLARRLERSRNALGNLAHALKGPLNLLTQYFDREEDGPERRGQARRQVERIRQLMERELRRARLAGRGVHPRRFDPREELPALIGVLEQMHPGRRLDVRCDIGDEVRPFGDREDMLELSGNLLDNACKWAASRVRCAVGGGDDFVLTVEDDGAGLSGQEIERLQERGVRLDESVEGDGLGLAIARDIVQLYGGRMVFDRSPDLGGLRERVVLPRSEPAPDERSV